MSQKHPEKHVCRICEDFICYEWDLEEILKHILECHPELLESLAIWIAERREAESK